ncbi:MAG: ABC transporter ATP-binding protein [Beijerinckiaceae bacterium]
MSTVPAPAVHEPSRRAVLSRLWRDSMAPYLPQMLLILLLVAIIAAATSLYPVLIKIAFDAFSGQAGSGAGSGLLMVARNVLRALFGEGATVIHVIALLVIVVTAIKGFSMLAQMVLTNRVVTRIEADMRTALYARLIDADLMQAQRASPAALTQRFTTDFYYIRDAMARIINVVIRDLVTALALVGTMIWIDWKLTLAALVVAPIVGIPIGQVGHKLRRISNDAQQQAGEMASFVSESLGGIRVAKSYGLEDYLKKRAAQMFAFAQRLAMKAVNARSRLDPLLEVGGGLAVAGVLTVIGLRIAQGESTVGDFTGFVTALLLAAQPIRSIGNMNAVLQEATAALVRVYGVMDEQPTIRDRDGAKPLAVQQGAVTFDHVRFGYHEDGAALNDVSLLAEAGKTTALVGRSGSGKSTLVALVPRLYDVQSGSVRIDGVDVRDVTLKSLRAQIAVVSQDVILFDDTIANNIAFGKPDVSRTDIEAAAKAAAAHDFIARLPQGYDTVVGPRGGALSGGERQRIVLARAFVRDAKILLLDEPTSALDAESEQQVQAALSSLMQGRTTLVIAHRLATVRDADKIVVMEQGRIVEEGRHEDLLARNGAYAKLHRLQFEGA